MDKVTAEVTYGAPYREDFADANPYTVTLRYQGREMAVPFYMGPALTEEPTARMVLGHLAMEASSVENARDFEDWAADFGYDTDSRKAEAMYRACVEQRDQLFALLESSTFVGLVFSDDPEQAARELTEVDDEDDDQGEDEDDNE